MSIDEISKLRNSVLNKLNSDSIEDNNECISLETLNEILKVKLGKYNKYFKEVPLKRAKKINNKTKFSRLFKESLYIYNVIPKIDENGNSIVEVDFVNDDNRYRGGMSIYRTNDKDCAYEQRNVYLTLNYEKNPNINEYINNYLNMCFETFKDLLDLLDEFKKENPNVSFEWDFYKYEPRRVEIVDGIFTGVINLDDLDRSHVCLKEKKDIELSRIKTKQFGYLDEYIAFNNDEFIKKICVVIDELEPNIKTLVKSYLKLEDDKKLKLE